MTTGRVQGQHGRPRGAGRRPATRSSSGCGWAAARRPARGTRARGKLLPRERVDRLLDKGAPFLELSPLAAHGMYDGDAPGAGIVTGVGRVSGRECVIVANDATVKGGTYYPMTVKKHLRAQEVALHNRLPCIYLVDSGGAFLPLQDEVFPDREHFGRIFFNQATMSERGHPADRRGDGLLHGRRRLRAGDERRVRDRPRAGHDLPRRPAAGEGGDRRGGHAPRSSAAATCTRAPRGVTDHLADDDEHALAIVRTIVATLAAEAAPRRGSARRSSRPRTTRDSIYGVVPADVRKPYDPHELIARLVDGSRFHEFKALYGTTLVVRLRPHPRPPGRDPRQQRDPVQRVRAQGRALHRALRPPQDPAASSCRTSAASWSAASTRRAASPSTARRWSPPSRCARVPKLTVIVGGSFGAGNYGMCGRAYSPRFLFMWPNARISRDGRRAGRDGDGDGRPAGGRRVAARPVRAPGPPVLRHRAAVGRRRDRPARHPRRARPRAVAPAPTRRSTTSATASSACSNSLQKVCPFE